MELPLSDLLPPPVTDWEFLRSRADKQFWQLLVILMSLVTSSDRISLDAAALLDFQLPQGSLRYKILFCIYEVTKSAKAEKSKWQWTPAERTEVQIFFNRYCTRNSETYVELEAIQKALYCCDLSTDHDTVLELRSRLHTFLPKEWVEEPRCLDPENHQLHQAKQKVRSLLPNLEDRFVIIIAHNLCERPRCLSFWSRSFHTDYLLRVAKQKLPMASSSLLKIGYIIGSLLIHLYAFGPPSPRPGNLIEELRIPDGLTSEGYRLLSKALASYNPELSATITQLLPKVTLPRLTEDLRVRWQAILGHNSEQHSQHQVEHRMSNVQEVSILQGSSKLSRDTTTNFLCEPCNSSFTRKAGLTKHMMSIHRQSRFWTCKAISNWKAAFHHDLQFPQVRIYNFCGGKFRTYEEDSLIAHLEYEHDFSCCNKKKFFRTDHFVQHVQHSHKGKKGTGMNKLVNAAEGREAKDRGN